MDRVDRENMYIKSHPLPVVTISGETTTIIMTPNSYNYLQIMRLVKPDACRCGCDECRGGKHSQCESDGQACYYDGKRRVDDGVWDRKPVK